VQVGYRAVVLSNHSNIIITVSMIESFWFENVLEYNQLSFTKNIMKDYLVINLNRRLTPLRFEFKNDILVRVIDKNNVYEVNEDVTLTVDMERNILSISWMNDEHCRVTGFMIDKPSDYESRLL